MTLRVALIDYGAGNLRSASKALERAALEHDIVAQVDLVHSADQLKSVDHIVLPGVGSFEHCMNSLAALPDMIDTLNECVVQKGLPFLGICVGMQLLAEEGHEHGRTKGLGWVRGTVERLTPHDPSLKIPHMGWNGLQVSEHGQSHPVFDHVEPDDHVYFVHSYHLVGPEDARIATADYGGPLTAAVARDTIVGVQFHPEKSQKVGLKLLGNFLEWAP